MIRISLGFSGLHCDRYSGISFNGYTSNLQSNLRTVPIDSYLQTLNIGMWFLVFFVSYSSNYVYLLY